MNLFQEIQTDHNSQRTKQCDGSSSMRSLPPLDTPSCRSTNCSPFCGIHLRHHRRVASQVQSHLPCHRCSRLPTLSRAQHSTFSLNIRATLQEPESETYQVPAWKGDGDELHHHTLGSARPEEGTSRQLDALADSSFTGCPWIGRKRCAYGKCTVC